jgi:hypothetical protein
MSPRWRQLADGRCVSALGWRSRRLRANLPRQRRKREPSPCQSTGHVRSIRSYQVRSFEVILAQVSNEDGQRVVFAGMPAEADRQRAQLRGVLHGLGAKPDTPITILSDGAEGP